MELMYNLCEQKYQRLLERLNEDIMAESMLERREPSQRFYINTDWSKYRMGVVLLK